MAATRAGRGRGDLVLHLHRLDHDHRLAGHDLVSRGDEHAAHGAGHGGHQRTGMADRVRVGMAGHALEHDVTVGAVDVAAVADRGHSEAMANAVHLGRHRHDRPVAIVGFDVDG